MPVFLFSLLGIVGVVPILVFRARRNFGDAPSWVELTHYAVDAGSQDHSAEARETGINRHAPEGQ